MLADATQGSTLLAQSSTVTHRSHVEEEATPFGVQQSDARCVGARTRRV
jgi:hypothetical protein